MEKVFTHENRLIVFNIKNVLQDAGIECLIKNEFASSGAGDLAPIETWPEIWVLDEADADIAGKVLAELDDFDGPVWLCPHCSETNEGNFKLCWNCNTAKE